MGKDKKEKKKRGFFRRLFRLAFLAGIVGAVAQALTRRRAGSVEESEWQELAPPPPPS
jgi:hypothetical protein